MSCGDSHRFLLLSGECPGEGVWCCAKTYAELVQCAQSAWGSDFLPTFKYKLPCVLTGAKSHTRSSWADEDGDGESTLQWNAPQLESNAARAVGTPCETRPSRCYVVLNDEDDFDLWVHGGAYCTPCPPAMSPAFAATTLPPRGTCVHHYSTSKGLAEEIMHTVGHHMDQRLSRCNTMTDSSAVAVADAAANRQHWSPQPLTSILFAFRSPVAADTSSSAPYRTSSGGGGRRRAPRASPPVRSADAEVITVPMQSLLHPALIIRLGVSVVLRHSAAPAEVILFSNRTSSGQGELPWGAVCVKARRAWGVHAPQFRYVDVQYGVTQMLINNVNDYLIWWRQAELGNCELLVVEQAPSASHGEVFALPDVQASISRYYEEEWPTVPHAPSWEPKNVVQLVRELKALEREERMAAVRRLGRMSASASPGSEGVALPEATSPLQIRGEPSSQPYRGEEQKSVIAVAIGAEGAVKLGQTGTGAHADRLSCERYRPILLEPHPMSTPAVRRAAQLLKAGVVPPTVTAVDTSAEANASTVASNEVDHRHSQAAQPDILSELSEKASERDRNWEAAGTATEDMAVREETGEQTPSVHSSADEGGDPNGSASGSVVSSHEADLMGTHRRSTEPSTGDVDSSVHTRARMHQGALSHYFRKRSTVFSGVSRIGTTPVW